MAKNYIPSLLAIAGLGIAGYFILKKFGKELFPITPEATAEKFTAMGYTSYPAVLEPNATYVKSGDALYRFSAGDYDKLNWAQKFLLSTKIIPTSWILG